MNADFHIINHGSIFTIRPLNPEAQAWWEANVDDQTGLYAVEPRYVEPIVEGILEEGMTIQ